MSTKPTSRAYPGPFLAEEKGSTPVSVSLYRARPLPGPEVGSRRRPSWHEGAPDNSSIPSGAVAVIYDKLLLAECLKTVLQDNLNAPVEIFPSLEAVKASSVTSKLILVFVENLRNPENFHALRQIATALPHASVVVLSHSRESRLVREVMECGVKAFIPLTMGFAVAIEAVKFVLAGGTYVPPESLMEAGAAAQPVHRGNSPNPVTLREQAIIQAIQQGKSNKIIAYELNLCESTVKVHIRNIMRKLRAKNRTEVAVRSAEFLAPVLDKVG